MGLVKLIKQSGTLVWGSGQWGLDTWGGLSDTEYVFPEGLALNANSFETRLEKSKLVFADGRKSTGGEVDDRGPVVEGYVEAETRAELRALINDMRVQCQQADRLKIDEGSYLRLAKLYRFEDEPERGWNWEVTKLRIEWQCDDPFWHAEDEAVVEVPVSGDGTFVIDLSGYPACVQGQHPIIKISSPVYLPVAQFELKSLTDGGLSMRYGDPYLGFGTTATIDCAEGTVARSDGTDTIRYFSGEFLRLVDGYNQFDYKGPACTLEFRWRPRWL